MQETNTLGLRVAGVTAVILLVLFGLYWGGRALLFPDEVREPSPGTEALTLAERTQDSDNDGVADLYETVYYNTDPQRADTDGDGTGDLEEILAGRDPLVPGPNDESRPITGSAVTQLDTYTQRYLAGLPDDIAREDILEQTKLAAFVDANKGSLLQALPSGTVRQSDAVGADAIGAYLDTISSSHNTSIQAITSSDIEAAFRLQVNSANTEPLQEIVIALQNNVDILKEVTAPSEVAALHTRLIAASQSLRSNSELLLNIQNDFVGGLIGARNIEELGSIFQELAAEIQALEAKYGLG